MNIFVTDEDPVVSAINLCDQHARSKMIIESCIMLQNAFSQDSLSHDSCPRTKTGRVRRRGKGYAKHQCTLWTIESQANFEWLLEHALAMVDERNFRWPNSPEHFSVSFLKWCKENQYNTIIERKDLTPSMSISSSFLLPTATARTSSSISMKLLIVWISKLDLLSLPTMSRIICLYT